MAEVAYAKIVYDADDRKFQAAAGRVSGAVDKNVNKFREMAAASTKAASAGVRSFRKIALAATAAAGGLALMSKRALAVGEDIADAANRTGAGIKVLQELRFAADQNGASAAALDDALLRLTRRMSLFAQDGTGPAAKAIQELGIQVTDADGKLRDSGEVFLELAEKLQTVENQAARAALASQLLGERSGPLLIPMLDLGRQGLEQYAQRARELGLVLDEVAVRKGAEANAKIRALGRAFSTQLNEAILDNVDSINKLVDAIGNLGPALSGAVGIVASVVSKMANIASAVSAIADEIRGIDRSAPATSPGPPVPDVDRPMTTGTYMLDPLTGDPYFLNPRGRGADPRTFGFDADEAALSRYRAIVEQTMAETSESVVKQEYAKYARLRELADQYRSDELDRERSFGAAKLGIMQQSGQQQIATFGGFLDKMAATATGAYGNMFRALAAIAGKEGLINTFRAASQALADPSVPFWAKAAAVGQVIATGMNLVQSIQQVSGVSAGGGVARSGGGVTPAPPAPPSGEGQFVNINVIGEVFGREQVVDLISRINEAIEDGTVIKGIVAT